ncbi:hypothetical protein SLS55_001678 [Diplodia seriata]|uniref:Uncharacterized protein n=1 Tax=Diplodia seriata TaxID=420778 RepID=A0ABR3CPZ0_9PEZI
MSFAPPNEAPACIDMQDLESCMDQMLYTDNRASMSSLVEVLELLRSEKHIHVYGVRLSADEFLHLGALIHSIYERVHNVSRGPGVIIIVDDIVDSFAKVTALASHITGERPSDSRYSNENVSAFSRVAIVRGLKPAYICPSTAEYRASLKAAASAAKGIFFIFTQHFAVNSAIWHSHNDPSLVLYIIDTFPHGSPPIAAISVFNALLFTSPSSTTNNNSANRGAITLADPRGNDTLPNIWPSLIKATERAHGGTGIPLAFFSPCSLRIQLHHQDIRTLSGLPSHLPALLPETTWAPSLFRTLDSLITTTFRLLAGGDSDGSTSPAGSPPRLAVADLVQRRLAATTGSPNPPWARRCLDPRSYGESDILAAVRGALVLPPTPLPYPASSDNDSNAVALPPTLAALRAAMTNPAPSAPASALARLAVGRWTDVDEESGSLWAMRATLASRSGGDAGAPADSVTFRAAARGSVYVVTAPPTMMFDDGEVADVYRHPRAVLDGVGERWEGYVDGVEGGRRGRVQDVEGGGGGVDGGNGAVAGDGFGVGRETAEAWMAVVVRGVVVGAVEEWGGVVAGRLAAAGEEGRKREVEGWVRAVVEAARGSRFAEDCGRALGELW